MSLSDKPARCWTGDLTTRRAARRLCWGVFWAVRCTLCKEQSEWRTDFPEWCFRCCWEEGRADWQPSLSLINKPQRWSGEMPLFLINKRDTAYAFPHKLSSGLSEEMWGGSHILWMEDVLWSWDKTGSAIRESRVWFVMDRAYRNCPKIFICCEVFCLPGLPLKAVSCRSGSTQRDLDRPNHKIRTEYDFKGASTILPKILSFSGVPGLKPSIQRVNILPRCPKKILYTEVLQADLGEVHMSVNKTSSPYSHY